MEYRRRRRRRSSSFGMGSARGGSASGSGAAKMVAALIVIAAIVYVVSASAVGTWIAERVIAPAFAAFDNLVQGSALAPTPSPSQDPGSVSIPQTQRGEQTVTGEVSIPALECFALQMGVYSELGNAEKEAATLQQRGAGGYVMEDSGKYRVLAAAYAAQESLKQVREQLAQEGMESASYVFSAPNSTLRVTAPQEQLDGITAGFAALKKLAEDMAEAALAFDQQQKTAQEGRDQATQLLQELHSARQAFEQVASVEHPVLDAAKACFGECETALQTLSAYNAESFVDFSAKMKYTHICIVHAYAKLLDQVSSL